jgi:hypothetical protein
MSWHVVKVIEPKNNHVDTGKYLKVENREDNTRHVCSFLTASPVDSNFSKTSSTRTTYPQLASSARTFGLLSDIDTSANRGIARKLIFMAVAPVLRHRFVKNRTTAITINANTTNSRIVFNVVVMGVSPLTESPHEVGLRGWLLTIVMIKLAKQVSPANAATLDSKIEPPSVSFEVLDEYYFLRDILAG